MDIAIIDSGINPWHSHVQGIEAGLAFSLNGSGEVVQGSDFQDHLGHGTAIAGIIREKVPLAKFYAVKIFHEKLEAPASLLLAALAWSIQGKIKIIHLSLGTEKVKYREALRTLCQKACDEGLLIIAAARGPKDRIFPAVFDTTIGVYWDKECDNGALVYHPGNAIEFGAYGRPRAIPGLPQERNFCGDSFAAAHVTVRAAQILEKVPGAGTSRIKQLLAEPE